VVRDVHWLLGDPAVVGQQGSAQARQQYFAVLDEIAVEFLEGCKQWLGGGHYVGKECDCIS
jgi:hypothetical protein